MRKRADILGEERVIRRCGWYAGVGLPATTVIAVWINRAAWPPLVLGVVAAIAVVGYTEWRWRRVLSHQSKDWARPNELQSNAPKLPHAEILRRATSFRRVGWIVLAFSVLQSVTAFALGRELFLILAPLAPGIGILVLAYASTRNVYAHQSAVDANRRFGIAGNRPTQIRNNLPGDST